MGPFIELPEENEIHIWSADLDSSKDHAAQSLSEDEVSRAERFRFEKHRHRFVAGRSILRTLIAHYLKTNPASLAFQYSDLGKPSLSRNDKPKPLWFNVSHSESSMLVAFSTTASIGVDIEINRTLPDEKSLVERFFESGEVEEYQGLPPELRTLGFFNGWTRKEAILKARGDGLNTPLDAFRVSLDPRKQCRVLEFIALEEDESEWTLLAPTLDDKRTAAVATRARVSSLQTLRYPPNHNSK